MLYFSCRVCIPAHKISVCLCVYIRAVGHCLFKGFRRSHSLCYVPVQITEHIHVHVAVVITERIHVHVPVVITKHIHVHVPVVIT